MARGLSFLEKPPREPLDDLETRPSIFENTIRDSQTRVMSSEKYTVYAIFRILDRSVLESVS